MADYGFKISQEGFDVKTCDDKDLVMSSKFNMLKTKATGSVTANTNVAHGLSYTPIYFTIFTDGGKTHFVGDAFQEGFVAGFASRCDATNLELYCPGGGASMRYYIFYQSFT